MISDEGYKHSAYLRHIRTPYLKQALRRMKTVLKNYDFDSIAYRGCSGSLFAVPLALSLNKNLILVRKKSEKSHRETLVEGYQASKRYVIVDDFVSSGLTFAVILHRVSQFASEAKCVGLLTASSVSQRSYLKKACLTHPSNYYITENWLMNNPSIITRIEQE